MTIFDPFKEFLQDNCFDSKKQNFNSNTRDRELRIEAKEGIVTGDMRMLSSPFIIVT